MRRLPSWFIFCVSVARMLLDRRQQVERFGGLQDRL
jgi:hypothetical protein